MFSSDSTAPRDRVAPRRIVALALAAGLVAAMAQAPGTFAQSPSPDTVAASPAPRPEPYPATVGAPGTQPMGATYQTWTERWWSWLFSFPASQDPSLATTCPESPADGPLILPQTFFGTVQQVTCTIDAGLAVLVNAGGTICSMEPDEMEADLLACLQQNDAEVLDGSIAVDGRLLPDIETYHVLTEPFDLVLGEDNLFGIPAGTVRAAGSGWTAILSDLAPGTHTIALRDEMEDPTLGRMVAETIVTLEVTE